MGINGTVIISAEELRSIIREEVRLAVAHVEQGPYTWLRKYGDTMTRKQLAQEVKRTTATISNWIEAGLIKAIPIGIRGVLIDTQSAIDYVTRG